MLQTIELEAIGRQGVLLKREQVEAHDIRDCYFSTFFRDILEEVGLDSTYFVVNAILHSNTKQRSCIVGHYIVENGMLIPINANAFRTLWELEA